MLTEEAATLIRWIRRLIVWGVGAYLSFWALGFTWLAFNH